MDLLGTSNMGGLLNPKSLYPLRSPIDTEKKLLVNQVKIPKRGKGGEGVRHFERNVPKNPGFFIGFPIAVAARCCSHIPLPFLHQKTS